MGDDSPPLGEEEINHLILLQIFPSDRSADAKPGGPYRGG
jgi:hypothetical protein